MKLSVYQKGIVAVYITELGNKVVKARDLHKALGVKEKFAQWVKRKITEHQLVDSKDFCSYSEKSEKPSGGRPTVDFVFRLHPAKKIALGTNNEIGDKVKDEFIRCEEIVTELRDRQLNIEDYADKKTQKSLVKQVGSVLFHNGDTTDIIEHHQKNCLIHFGLRPSQLKESLTRAGYKVKSKSAREIARTYKPETACSMAMHDDMVSKGHTLEKLDSIKLKDKLEPAFKAIIDLGFIPTQLVGKKNL